MPKKSKREKILADLRRRVRTERVLTITPATLPIQNHTGTFRFVREETHEKGNGELLAIKKDLTKTMILATIAIAAELALFWFGKGKI